MSRADRPRHLAQVNLGRLRVDLDDPRAADFLNGRAVLDRVLERQAGFVWRHARAFGDATPVIPDDPRVLISLSVWRDLESLRAFVWKTVHRHFWDRRGEWFEPPADVHHALWWVEPGHEPTVDEALDRLERRRAGGDGPEAFGWDYAARQVDGPVI